MPFLVAFDFDRTIMEENTDSVVQIIGDSGPLPHSVESVKSEGWTPFMQSVFRHLRSKGIRQDDYRKTLDSMELVPGMSECLKTLKSEFKAEIIIISDSNSFFISHLLQRHGLSDVFDAVYTNPGSFEEDETLLLRPYHRNEECPLSAKNMCKGKILEEHLKNNGGNDFDFVAYAGDGSNDFCAMHRLTGKDLALPRFGDEFAIERVIEKRKKQGYEIKSKIVPWKDHADEILSAISNHQKIST